MLIDGIKKMTTPTTSFKNALKLFEMLKCFEAVLKNR